MELRAVEERVGGKCKSEEADSAPSLGDNKQLCRGGRKATGRGLARNARHGRYASIRHARRFCRVFG